ncbi:MAG: MBL fold metallo-hydrolase [Gammaproteobacteria bacterium]|nr:MBL fold metallo-hydrolase [Gammaproteobacteria bacterium]
MSKAPKIRSFFDETTYTVTHVLWDADTKQCAVIDSVLDYDAASGRTQTASADEVISFIRSHDLSLQWILETHAHADHLSAAPYIKKTLGGQIGIGEHIKIVQEVFTKVFNLDAEEFKNRSAYFDVLFKDGQSFQLGNLTISVLHTPGHTPACITYLIDDAAFVGDTMFMPDYGTARCDFPGGDAATLYRSIHKIFALPENTRLFMCHDYKAPGRDEFAWETTVAEQRSQNVHINDSVSEEQFVTMRTARDKTLNMPKLIMPSIQVNIRAGELPEPDSNGIRYLKIPLNAL